MKNLLTKSLGLVAAAAITLAPLTASADSAEPHGTFTGASNHVTTGGVKIVKTADGGALVILDTDFSLDGGPDPRVGFGTDGTFSEATDLGKLQNLGGLQIYVVPASIDVDDFNEVYIWCKKFSVPLGIADLH